MTATVAQISRLSRARWRARSWTHAPLRSPRRRRLPRWKLGSGDAGAHELLPRRKAAHSPPCGPAIRISTEAKGVTGVYEADGGIGSERDPTRRVGVYVPAEKAGLSVVGSDDVIPRMSQACAIVSWSSRDGVRNPRFSPRRTCRPP